MSDSMVWTGTVLRGMSMQKEDDDLHDNEENEAKTYRDENDRTRSLFSGMPSPSASPPIMRLRVGAKVLCTQKLSKDVAVGCMGVVVAFRDAAESMQVLMLSKHDLGMGWIHRW